MRVAFLTTSFPRFDGDYAGIFVYDLAYGLTAQGIDVTVLAPHEVGYPKREVMDSINVVRFPYFLPYRFQRLAYGAGILTNLRSSTTTWLQIFPFLLTFSLHLLKMLPMSDLIHAHWIEPAFLGLLGRLAGVPLVVSVHRLHSGNVMNSALNRFVLSHADAVLFNSTYTRNQFAQVKELNSGIIIPPSIDMEKFRPKWEVVEKTASLHGAPHPATVLTIARLVPFKGLIHLVEAMPQVLAQISCQFVIGGDGPERNRLAARADELGVSSHLTFLGQVRTDEVPKLMRSADVFVLPSVPYRSGENETLGMVLVEALASGTPCIASDTGGIPDIVDDGVNGYLITPGCSAELAKKVIRLLSDTNLRTRFAKAGREKVERVFSNRVIAQSVESVYRNVLRQRQVKRK